MTLLDGVASYGRRPTFDNGPPLLEVFAFDFSGDLYGEQVIVVFHDWIRAEAKLPSVDALVERCTGRRGGGGIVAEPGRETRSMRRC